MIKDEYSEVTKRFILVFFNFSIVWVGYVSELKNIYKPKSKRERFEIAFSKYIPFNKYPELYFLDEERIKDKNDGMHKLFDIFDKWFRSDGTLPSGTYILFGKKGIGKTSFLSYLIGKYRDSIMYSSNKRIIYMSPEIVKEPKNIIYYIYSYLKLTHALPSNVEMKSEYMSMELLSLLKKYNISLIVILDNADILPSYGRRNLSYNAMLDTVHRVYTRYMLNANEYMKMINPLDAVLINILVVDRVYDETLFQSHDLSYVAKHIEMKPFPPGRIQDILYKRVRYVDEESLHTMYVMKLIADIMKFTIRYADGSFETAINVARDVFEKVFLEGREDINEDYILEVVKRYSERYSIENILKLHRNTIITLAGFYKVYDEIDRIKKGISDEYVVDIYRILDMVRVTAKMNGSSLYSTSGIKYHLKVLRDRGIIGFEKYKLKGYYRISLRYNHDLYRRVFKNANIILKKEESQEL